MAGTPAITMTVRATELPLVQEYMEALAVQLQGLITENERLEERLVQAEKVIEAAKALIEAEWMVTVDWTTQKNRASVVGPLRAALAVWG